MAGQLTVPPQASPMSPQYCWTPLLLLQVVFTQVGPPTQVFLVLSHCQPEPAAEQSEVQSFELPQPSPMVPQYRPPPAGVQDTGTQPAAGPALHWLFWQVQLVVLQVVPQWTVPPHPSPMSPQY